MWSSSLIAAGHHEQFSTIPKPEVPILFPRIRGIRRRLVAAMRCFTADIFPSMQFAWAGIPTLDPSTRGRTFCPPLPQTLFLRLERAHGTGSGDGSGNLTERLQDSWTTVVSGQSAICYVQIRRCGFVFALQVPSGFGGLQYLNFYPVGTFFP